MLIPSHLFGSTDISKCSQFHRYRLLDTFMLEFQRIANNVFWKGRNLIISSMSGEKNIATINFCHVPVHRIHACPRERTATSACIRFVSTIEWAVTVVVINPALGYDRFRIAVPSRSAHYRCSPVIARRSVGNDKQWSRKTQRADQERTHQGEKRMTVFHFCEQERVLRDPLMRPSRRAPDLKMRVLTDPMRFLLLLNPGILLKRPRSAFRCVFSICCCLFSVWHSTIPSAWTFRLCPSMVTIRLFNVTGHKSNKKLSNLSIFSWF